MVVVSIFFNDALELLCPQYCSSLDARVAPGEGCGAVGCSPHEKMIAPRWKEKNYFFGAYLAPW